MCSLDRGEAPASSARVHAGGGRGTAGKSLDLNYATVDVIRRVVHHNADLVGSDVREDELAFHQIISSHSSAWHVHKSAAVPVLHIEVRNAVTGECSCVSDGTATVEVVLQ